MYVRCTAAFHHQHILSHCIVAYHQHQHQCNHQYISIQVGDATATPTLCHIGGGAIHSSSDTYNYCVRCGHMVRGAIHSSYDTTFDCHL